MAKKSRPSLKDYLRTGIVRFESTDSDAETLEATAPESTREHVVQDDAQALAESLLSSLSERDRSTWEPVLKAGTAIESADLDLLALRRDFRDSDRDRFTYYLLEREGEHLRPIRTSVQIREPIKFLLKWDETGALTLYKQP